MAAHTSDWGYSLNQFHRGGQTAHHGDDVCGGGCIGARLNSCTIPTMQHAKPMVWEFSFPTKPSVNNFSTIVVCIFFSRWRSFGWVYFFSKWKFGGQCRPRLQCNELKTNFVGKFCPIKLCFCCWLYQSPSYAANTTPSPSDWQIHIYDDLPCLSPTGPASNTTLPFLLGCRLPTWTSIVDCFPPDDSWTCNVTQCQLNNNF